MILSGVYLLSLALTPTIATLPIVLENKKKIVEKKLEEPASATNTVYIPKIGVDVEIVEGEDESALLRGAWHRRPENGNPKNGGNFVVSAHRFNLGYTPAGTLKKSPFYNIDKLEVGDTITVDYNKKRYDYTINRLYSVQPEQVSIENRTEANTLTLYSCTLRGSVARDVVVAYPINQ